LPGNAIDASRKKQVGDRRGAKAINGTPSKAACLQGIQGALNRENPRKAGLKGEFVAGLSNVLRKPPCHRAKYLQQSAPVLQTLGT
jgi:hypothetical protein